MTCRLIKYIKDLQFQLTRVFLKRKSWKWMLLVGTKLLNCLRGYSKKLEDARKRKEINKFRRIMDKQVGNCTIKYPLKVYGRLFVPPKICKI